MVVVSILPHAEFGANDYTQCTLKLRPVKLLFVIFGRLSYLILKITNFSSKNDRFSTGFSNIRYFVITINSPGTYDLALLINLSVQK